MSRWEAYWEAGFIRPYDFVMLAVFGLALAATGLWCLVASPSPAQVTVALLAASLVLQVWSISLVFRCSDFVLSVHADIHLMPVEAARIVTAHASGATAPAPRR